RLSTDVLKLLEESGTAGLGRRHNTTFGQLVKVQTTDVVERWPLFEINGAQSRGEELTNAQGFFHLSAYRGAGDDVRLSILPEIEFGERKTRHVAAPDLTGWQVRSDRESRPFPSLQSEITVAPGEYLLVGADANRTGGMGFRFFVKQLPNGKYQQTALLIRVVRPSAEALYTAGYRFDEFFLSPSARDADPQAATPATARALVDETAQRTNRKGSAAR
ncbi:MAG: hypothetical protein ACRDD1_16800, partial [Planctomycetia bacterium]